MAAAQSARADEHMVLLDTITIPGKPLAAFDISFVDPILDLYVLADRSNASVQLFDASDNTFIDSVGGFAGAVINPATGAVNNNVSGPDGVVTVRHREVWAGDGDSTVKVIDIPTRTIVATISTGGKFRADEMAYDGRDQILAVANNADDPPFVSLIDTQKREVIAKIVFDGTNGTPEATNGVEQPQWSPKTGLFYISVPQIGPNLTDGGVAVIDPKSAKVTQTFPVSNCGPAGLTLGPDGNILLGCGQTTPPVQSLVINQNTGAVVATLAVGGSDEVWFDRGSGHYYLAARANPSSQGGPGLGVVDSSSNVLNEVVPTSASAHSVAADPVSGRVFVPIGVSTAAQPNTICPTNGCIAVYGPSAVDDDDTGRLADDRAIGGNLTASK